MHHMGHSEVDTVVGTVAPRQVGQHTSQTSPPKQGRTVCEWGLLQELMDGRDLHSRLNTMNKAGERILGWYQRCGAGQPTCILIGLPMTRPVVHFATKHKACLQCVLSRSSASLPAQGASAHQGLLQPCMRGSPPSTHRSCVVVQGQDSGA